MNGRKIRWRTLRTSHSKFGAFDRSYRPKKGNARAVELRGGSQDVARRSGDLAERSGGACAPAEDGQIVRAAFLPPWGSFGWPEKLLQLAPWSTSCRSTRRSAAGARSKQTAWLLRTGGCWFAPKHASLDVPRHHIGCPEALLCTCQCEHYVCMAPPG